MSEIKNIKMASDKDIETLVEKGIVESMDYYYGIEFNINPLLDYLTISQIKTLQKWLENTYSEMNLTEVNNCGIEYLIAVKKYAEENCNRKENTAYGTN